MPPGFGTQGAVASADLKVTEQDLRDAQERIKRSDANKDGVLDAKEIVEARLGDEAKLYDRNKDGKLTAAELAQRYARRRAGQTAPAAPQNVPTAVVSISTSRPPGPAPPSTPAPGGVDPAMEGIVNRLFERYDTDKSGVLEQGEWKQFRSDPSAADKNPKDGKITKQELAAWFAERFRSGGFGGGPGGPGGGPPFGPGGDRGGFGRDGRGEGGERRFYAAREGSEGPSDRGRGGDGNRGGDWRSQGGQQGQAAEKPPFPYRPKSLAERLPAGLAESFPEFVRNDTDADGQISMAEFSASWNESTLADFAKFDLNGDGLITPKECQEAIKRGATRGEAAPTPSAPAAVAMASAPPAPAAPSASSAPPATASGSAAASSGAAPVAPSYLKYAQSLVKKYDTNKDAVLTQDEWKNMSNNPQEADADRDGKITPEELAAWLAKR